MCWFHIQQWMLHHTLQYTPGLFLTQLQQLCMQATFGVECRRGLWCMAIRRGAETSCQMMGAWKAANTVAAFHTFTSDMVRPAT